MVLGRSVISKGMFALWGAGFALLPGVASAAGAARPDIEACRKHADDRARLACYDRALPPAVDVAAQGKASPSMPPAPQSVPAPVAAAGMAGHATTATMPSLNGLSTSASPGVAGKPQAQAGTARQGQVGAPVTADFGLPQKPAFERAEALETSIAGNFDGWGPDEKITLANGQVWQINDGSSAGYSLRDPKVRITRGSFGGFFMQVEGVSQTPRVKRLR